MTPEETLIEIGRLRERERWLMDALAAFADVSVESYVSHTLTVGAQEGGYDCYNIEGGVTVADLLHAARVYRLAKGDEVRS